MANGKRRTLTAEQQAKSDARRARFSELAKQIGAMTPEQQLQFASSMATTVTIEGRSLSLHNACLLACQCPHATLVGGFQQWLAAGRCVRKGESGLMIWAPARQKEDPNRQPGEISTKDRPRFIMITVFDVSQTDVVEMATPAKVIAGGSDAPIAPERPGRACAWCRGSGVFDERGNHPRACSHPPRVTVRAIKGAEWRVTKWEGAEGAQVGRKLPEWKAPGKGLYPAFAKACAKPLPLEVA